MEHTQDELDKLLVTVRLVREQREQFEAALDRCRRESRALAIELIFDHGFSVNRTSMLTGHMRPTLMVWVNLEIERRSDLGLQSPSHVRK
jgi:hypothetical protein